MQALPADIFVNKSVHKNTYKTFIGLGSKFFKYPAAIDHLKNAWILFRIRKFSPKAQTMMEHQNIIAIF